MLTIQRSKNDVSLLLMRSKSAYWSGADPGKPSDDRKAKLAIPFPLARIQEILLLWECHALQIFFF